MAKKKNSAFLSRLAIGLIFALAVIYAAYHMISLFTPDDIKTIESGVTTHSDTVGGSGYVFRDETLLTADNVGVVDYKVPDGGRVSYGQKVADIYEGSREYRETVTILDGQIAMLEKSLPGSDPLDMGALREDANDAYYKLMEMLATGKAGQLASQIENIMVALNRISAMSSDRGSIEKTLQALKNAREGLFKGEFQSGYSPASGYFYYGTDGYESLFTVEAADNLTEDSFKALIEKLNDDPNVASGKVFGKLAQSSGWKFALPLSKRDTETLEVDKEYNLTFSENNGARLPMTLEKKLETADGEQVICVFYCNRLPADFSMERCQSVELELTSATGIYVPRSALTSLNGVRGVYVLRGSVVHFRRVEIVYRGVDYCLVSESQEEVDGYYPLGTNELIIYEGKNLFDGRILE